MCAVRMGKEEVTWEWAPVEVMEGMNVLLQRVQKRGGIAVLMWELVCVHVLETSELLLLQQEVLPSAVTVASVIFKKTRFGNSLTDCFR